jgi:dTDP-4-amino-4,6-dideoxygalactose transaminase
MQVPLVDLKAQYRSIKGEVLAEISRALDGMQLFLGENVREFESEFASYCGTEFAIGVGSGTEALHLSLLAAGIGPGDEVITVSNTFIATVEAIVLAGARPVFVDIDADTYNIDTSQIEGAISPRTRAILPVHLYGHPADMGPVLELAEAYKLKVIEDACQSHGAEYKGRRTGSLGDAGCFSFYFTKNLGAYGEAGMITTSDPDVAERCRMLRDHGQTVKYYHRLVGVNGRLDEIQAAVLRVKLPHLDDWNEKRRSLAQAYESLLPSSVITPVEVPWARHVYYAYVVRTANRDELQAWLTTKDIGTGIHFPVPIHLQEAYSEFDYANTHLPVTEKVAKEIISLPMYPELRIDQINYICDCIREFTESELKVA